MAQRIDWLVDHPQIVFAARIAHTFGLDPVAVLRDDGDVFLTLVRAAAARVVQADEQASADAARR